MAQTPTRLAAAVALGTVANTTVYTAPAGKTVIVKQIIVTNTSAAAVTVNVGGTLGFYFAYGLSLPVGGTTIIDASQVMNAGETLTAWASAGSAVSLGISGVVSP